MGRRLYMIPEASRPKRWSQMANVSPERADARPSEGPQRGDRPVDAVAVGERVRQTVPDAPRDGLSSRPR